MNNFNMRYAFGLLCCFALFACSGSGNDVDPTNESPTRDTDTNADNSKNSDSIADNSENADTIADSAEDTDTNRPVPNRDADKLSGLESTPDIDWLTIEKGTFTFGSPPTSPCRGAYSETEFPVTLTRSFLIAATELTQAQWEALDLPHASWTKGADIPVSTVNFFEVAAWCNKLSRLENLEPCYDLGNCENEIGVECINNEGIKFPSCGSYYEFAFRCTGNIHRFPDRYSCPGYRLPTSAEWEYAAKADVTETHTYGGDLHNEPLTACNEQPALEDIAWYCHNSGGEVHPVAQKQPNPWGLYDTLGNVYEWVDTFHNGGSPLSYEAPGTPLTDPVGIAYEDGIEMRGCHYEKTGCQLRPTERTRRTKTDRSTMIGFRPVRTILE
ncbi:MAG: SUMF1/EgtB/PvdO family nonheme iron enzyme [Proteobacteria bacterium]|nr:SUMF1/EgtB/PvdO family nonheme iron enzyme [Pseudomonadota bacterium]